MERVKKGERYWSIVHSEKGLVPCYFEERGDIYDDNNFASGNYFHTEEEANQMLKKLRAVLNGADVIETPSEDEILNTAMQKFNGEEDSARDILDFQIACRWLKSKIVK